MASSLILDEGVDPDDIQFIVVDEETGIEHWYNPPLASDFSLVIKRLEAEGRR